MHSRLTVRRIFRLGILVKGFDGALEVGAGLVLLLFKPGQLDAWVVLVTAPELSEDPGDWVANSLLHLATVLSVSTELFAALYLLSHGVVKVLLVLSLWRERQWAYPAAIALFSLFVVYELYRFSRTQSPWLAGLAVLDAGILALTVLEFGRLRTGRAGA